MSVGGVVRGLYRTSSCLLNRTSSAHFSSKSRPNDRADTPVLTPKYKIRRIEAQEQLFAIPGYFDIPVLMLHAQYTDFACSFHHPDKLEEMDCLWSTFPCDLKVYGSWQRTEVKTVQMIMARAHAMLIKQEVKELRIVSKGYGKSLMSALSYLEDKCENIHFLSVTDLTRKLGEESVVYQRALPHYPKKRSMDSMMKDGPEYAPKSLLEKFRRLNVYHIDVAVKGEGLLVKSTEAKASKRGYITKKSNAVKKTVVNKLAVTNELK